MNNLILWATVCAIVTISVLSAIWYFAGSQYVFLLITIVWLVWFIPEFWGLWSAHSRGKR